MAADVFLSFHLICDCCRARVVSCFIITRVTVLVGVYCYWYGSIRFLCCISISSYRTGGCLLLLVWQHSILVLYLYIELPYWWVSIVTGMEAFDSCALYLYIELPYLWVSIVTGMAALDYCAISLYRVTVLVGVYCYWYDSIRFLCYISISSYRTGGCLLLLVWQHSILVLYLYFELPYWWVSIVTGMEAFDSCALYLYIELPYWWVSIVTGMAAFDSCAISLFRVTLLVGVYCYWYGSIRFLCYISISSYRTGGCLLLLVWQHSILVLYLYIECYSVYICSCLYGLVSLCKSYIRLSVCTLSGFVLCIICLLNKCKKWQQTCFCHFI